MAETLGPVAFGLPFLFLIVSSNLAGDANKIARLPSRPSGDSLGDGTFRLTCACALACRLASLVCCAPRLLHRATAHRWRVPCYPIGTDTHVASCGPCFNDAIPASTMRCGGRSRQSGRATHNRCTRALPQIASRPASLQRSLSLSLSLSLSRARGGSLRRNSGPSQVGSGSNVAPGRGESGICANCLLSAGHRPSRSGPFTPLLSLVAAADTHCILRPRSETVQRALWHPAPPQSRGGPAGRPRGANIGSTAYARGGCRENL